MQLGLLGFSRRQGENAPAEPSGSRGDGTELSALAHLYTGGSEGICRESGTEAATNPGARMVHICPNQFIQAQFAAPGYAAALIIHEELHVLGLNENPPHFPRDHGHRDFPMRTMRARAEAGRPCRSPPRPKASRGSGQRQGSHRGTRSAARAQEAAASELTLTPPSSRSRSRPSIISTLRPLQLRRIPGLAAQFRPATTNRSEKSRVTECA